MNFATGKNKLQKVIEQRNGYLLLGVAGLGICIIQAVIIYFMMNRQTIILVPPVIEQAMSVTNNSVSSEYLNDMSTFFANLRFNLTSDNATHQQELLLRYTLPQSYNAFKAQLIKEFDHISSEHLTTVFIPATVQSDSKHLKTIISGDLKEIVGDVNVPSKKVTFLIEYKFLDGKLYIKNFEEYHG